MKVKTTKTNLVTALATARKAVPSSAQAKSQPILANVLFQVQGKRLRFSGTDHVLYVTTWFDGEIEEPGGVALPADVLSRMLPDLPDEVVHIQVNERTFGTTIRCGDFSTTLRGLDPKDYVTVPDLPKEGVDLDPLALKTALSRVLIAAAKETGAKRPSHTGAFFTIADKKLSIICTDTTRLAYDTIDLQETSKSDIPASFLVSARPLRELQRVIADEPNRRVTFSFEGKLIAIRYASVEFISTAIADQFPENVRTKIDSATATPTTKVRIHREGILKAARLASSVLDDTVRHIRFEVDPATMPDRVRIVGQSKSIGEVADLIPAKVEGEALQVNLSPSMLQEGLSTFGSDEIDLRFVGPLAPVAVVGEERSPHRFFFAPVKVTEES